MVVNKVSNKFDAVPIDADTQILFQLNAKLDDYDVFIKCGFGMA